MGELRVVILLFCPVRARLLHFNAHRQKFFEKVQLGNLATLIANLA